MIYPLRSQIYRTMVDTLLKGRNIVLRLQSLVVSLDGVQAGDLFPFLFPWFAER